MQGQRRAARRSSSHGALHSAYSSHGRHGQMVPHRSHGRCRSLRSVSENASFLASPGPLESMLKTTTETGDIGIFTIRSVPKSHTSRRVHRSKPVDRSDALASQSSNAAIYIPPPIRDDRLLLPSYRDTTSEILSLYGSEGQRSVYSSLSLQCDGSGLRSYSMTSSVSRRLRSQGSDRTLFSQASSGILQRPRSPFPYPTRLKRPGVRPASPALTENGRVDYSRMVEIDRVSYVSLSA